MIPLVWFLAVWLVLLVILALMTLLTVAMTMRYGLSCFCTYLMLGLFLAVIGLVLFLTGSYLLSVDWSQNVSLFSQTSSWLPF